MPTFDCPQCPDGELVYTWQQDSQGEGPWSMSFMYPELSEQTCSCDLPAEVFDEIERKMAENPDYYRYEPDFLD